jgi:4-amino-4-deoxy-L-arabinose transferase-like glycosyltransferase
VKSIVFLILGMTALRLALAAAFPMTNDEAYYWDWARAMQLSYFDHPPGVAWMTWVAQHLASGNLAVRLLSPLAHAVATLFLLLALDECRPRGDRQARLWLVALTQLAPGLSLWGAIALPDTGLLPLASLTLYLCLRYSRRTLSIPHGLALGLVLGLAGCFKYHALPVCGGLAVGLAVERGGVRRDLPFWLAVVAAGLVGTMPVWLWNLQNDFASFRFQGAHGFAGLSLRPLYLGRVVVGQLLLVTPLVFFTAFSAARGRPLAALGFYPLALLILGVAPFKQMLPHWILPAFWVVLPFVAVKLRATRFALGQTSIFGLMTLLLPWILAAKPLRDLILEKSNGDPSHLAELTLWPDLAAEVTRLRLTEPLPEEQAAAERCGGVIVVTQRWFWGAQLAFHLPGQPRVRVVDANRGSYYDQRDGGESLTGCPALLLADEDHVDQALLATRLDLATPPVKLKVPRHERLEVVMARGSFR